MNLNKFRKNILTIILAATCALCGCQESGYVNIENAENYEGITFETTEKPLFTYVTPEDETVTKITEITEISEISETSEKTEKTETTAMTSTAEITETTEKPKTTTKETTKSNQTTTTTQTTTEPTIITTTATSAEITAGFDEVRAVWISYLELNPILIGKTKDEFKKSFGIMMDNVLSLGLNTVFVQLRAFGDAFYFSDFFHMSRYVTGEVGKDAVFDPLEIMLSEAHSRNISFHGWINPLRICTDSDIKSVPENFPIAKWYDSDKRGKYIVKVGTTWYLNPAYSEVQNLILSGAAEICKKYNVDGLHIDDYFYPTTDESFDSEAFSESSFSDLKEFRMNSINKLVKGLYETVKSADNSLLFGISPQGSIKNNLNNLYANVKLWASQRGYCDYIAPQLYYGFENSSEPYLSCLGEWEELTGKSNIKLIAGLSVYKIGNEDKWAGDGKNEWKNSGDILKRQILAARETKTYYGISFYSYNYLFSSGYVTAEIKAEIEEFKKIL